MITSHTLVDGLDGPALALTIKRAGQNVMREY